MAVGWKDCELFPEGLILNLLLGETFISFQMDRIAKTNFGEKIYKMDILGEYERRSEKPIFGVTTKTVTKFNKNKSKCANSTTRIKLKI